ncbi:MAG: PIN domain-containing protein [Verrucomicrobia bacterium]|nr:PIN domain-containing protein [Verrucomicrobiota bacterium]
MNRPFLDTSILIGGLIDFGETSRAPIELLDRIAEGHIAEPATAWHCCLEFYSVTTRLPEEYRLPPETAKAFVLEEIVKRLSICALDPVSHEIFLTNAARQGIRGGRIYDFHIGSIALKANASVIITENKKHFSNFENTGTPVLNAQEFLRAL